MGAALPALQTIRVELLVRKCVIKKTVFAVKEYISYLSPLSLSFARVLKASLT
jgi:hypothetical protein